MRYFLIGTAVVLVVLFVVFAYSRAGRQRNLQEYFIHICIPYSSIPKFDPNQFAQEFTKKWKTQVACGMAKDIGPAKKGLENFLMGNGTNNVRITVSEQPLPTELVNTTIMGSPNLTDADKAALRNHKGYVTVDYLLGPEKPTERVNFSAQVLLSLLQQQGPLGHVNVSAMLYAPRKESESYITKDKLEPTDLYSLFIGQHLVDEGEISWLHTHGMEQFG